MFMINHALEKNIQEIYIILKKWFRQYAVINAHVIDILTTKTLRELRVLNLSDSLIIENACLLTFTILNEHTLFEGLSEKQTVKSLIHLHILSKMDKPKKGNLEKFIPKCFMTKTL